jgi:hypothetical protein
MGVYDETVYTAACDVCDELFGAEYDWSLGWSLYSTECEDMAIRGGWTKTDDELICDSTDENHKTARKGDPDTRPKPGPGQLAINLKDAT